jgi:hypothetical protein
MTAEFRRPRAHAVWARPKPWEDGAPEQRVIHVFHAGLGVPTDARIGVRAARGYRKCGSRDETDWIRDVRVMTWDGNAWDVAFEARDVPRADDQEIHWLPAGVRAALGVMVEVRRSWIDDWWPSWNLVSRGVVVDADWVDPPLRPRPATPLPAQVDLDGLPRGITATRLGGELRYRTPVLEVGFRLGRPALSFLDFDPDGLPDPARDLLRHANIFEGDGNDFITNHALFGQFPLGPQVVTPDGISHIGHFAPVDSGRVVVEGPTVSYELDVASAGVRMELRWTVYETGLRLDMVRDADAPLRAVESSAWHFAFDARVTPPCLIGRPERDGETGVTRTPAILHAPGRGSLAISMTGDTAVRFEAARPLMTTGIGVMVGETPGELGDSILAAGLAEGAIRFEVTNGTVPALTSDTPAPVAAGIRRAWLSSLTYRLDTAVLANNGNSIYVPACLDDWGILAADVGPVHEGIDSFDLLRDTIDRYLDDGPGYMAGRTSFHQGLVQDEYIHTDCAVLLGIACAIAGGRSTEWLATRASAIRGLFARAVARDVDGDGLIEGSLRTGITGSGEWSTNTWDTVSFGWKDAYSNAVLYDALMRLAAALPGGGWPDLRTEASERAARLEAAYEPTFWNPETGWIGGWRSPDDRLHDAGYLPVNGHAVMAGLLGPDRARTAIEGLWTEIRAAGFDDFRLGLPLTARPIPRGDFIEHYAGMPFGYVMPHGFNMNGSASLTGVRPFVTAMRRVGMEAEADLVLEGALGALADGSAIGGCTSGVDLKTWDGTPCGYEGILTNQFGVVAAALERYGAGPR